MEIFNPSSGNNVNIDWAESQGIIDRDGNYLDEDNNPTTILEVADPDLDFTDDELQEKAKETRAKAEERFGGGSGFETSDGDTISDLDQAQSKIEELLGDNNELQTQSNFLQEEKARLEKLLEEARERLESSDDQIQRLRNQLENAEDTILDLRDSARRARQERDDAEDRVDELEDTGKQYEETDRGGIRVS